MTFHIRPILKMQAAVGALIFLSLVGTKAGQAQALVRLHGRGSVTPGVMQSQVLGHMSETSNLSLAISLPVQNQSALDSAVLQLSDPKSPYYRQYLTTDQFNDAYGPTEADYNTVIDYLKSHGFTVSATYGNRMLVDVTGSVANIEQTFHVNMLVYQHPTENRTFYGPDAEPTLDQDLPILDISGLDNFVLPQSFVHATPAVTKSKAGGSGPSGNLVGSDFPHAYASGTSLTGSGQTIALFQLGSYYPSDISAYCSQFGLPSANITQVLLDGVSSTPAAGSDTIEQSLDIEMVHSMAPQANILFYNGTSAADVWNRIASDNLAKSVSSSWATSPPPSTMSQILEQMAAQGQSVFQASGDSGYQSTPFGWGDNPYIICVGGTNLTTSSAGGPWSSETGWSDSGGYISSTYSIPSWQQGVNMAACGGSTTMRDCPDVAMVATGIWDIYSNGTSGGVLGTSCAAPLWAGYLALVNQQAASDGLPTAGFINPAVYGLGLGTNYNGNFHDITSGNNGEPCVTGYDLVTGWGSPTGTTLITSLSGILNYKFVCSENQTEFFSTPVDVAFGANGSYSYLYGVNGSFTFNNTTFGGDPAPGIVKSGFYRSFIQSVSEGSSATFSVPVEAAYGANGSYYYNWGLSGTVAFNNTAWGGDPAPNVVKAGYYMPYTECAAENGTVTFTTPTNVAFGANGLYEFKQAFVGTITFNDATFGDPDYGVVKAGYFRPSP